jgi:hypothetical protein
MISCRILPPLFTTPILCSHSHKIGKNNMPTLAAAHLSSNRGTRCTFPLHTFLSPAVPRFANSHQSTQIPALYFKRSLTLRTGWTSPATCGSTRFSTCRNSNPTTLTTNRVFQVENPHPLHRSSLKPTPAILPTGLLTTERCAVVTGFVPNTWLPSGTSPSTRPSGSTPA